MAPSERFKPIQRLASQRERKAAAALGESLKARAEAKQRLEELRQYHAEYLADFSRRSRDGLSSSQVVEYQVFIGKLETAIAQQEAMVDRSEAACDSSKANWRGRYSKSKAMDNAVDRMRTEEERQQERKEQSESDERSQRKR